MVQCSTGSPVSATYCASSGSSARASVIRSSPVGAVPVMVGEPAISFLSGGWVPEPVDADVVGDQVEVAAWSASRRREVEEEPLLTREDA